MNVLYIFLSRALYRSEFIEMIMMLTSGYVIGWLMCWGFFDVSMQTLKVSSGWKECQFSFQVENLNSFSRTSPLFYRYNWLPAPNGVILVLLITDAAVVLHSFIFFFTYYRMLSSISIWKRKTPQEKKSTISRIVLIGSLGNQPSASFVHHYILQQLDNQ